MIRRARAVELIQGNMPLPAVQKLMGHSTPNLTAAHVSFSDEDLQSITKLFMEREAYRKTSARNAFWGKIVEIQHGDIQARITLVTISGHQVAAIITNDSLDRLGLQPGRLVTAEVKAPWIILFRAEKRNTYVVPIIISRAKSFGSVEARSFRNMSSILVAEWNCAP